MRLKEIEPNFFTLDESEPLARLLSTCYRWYSPRFSPRDIPRFADVGSITESPEAMKGIRDFFVDRYKRMASPPTHILGFDARGFLFGPMVAVELGIPFVLMRKADKNAGYLIKSEPYDKEYREAAPEVMTIRWGSIGRGARVVLMDDVIATGGTAISGLQLVEASAAEVIEMVTVLSLPSLKGAHRIHTMCDGRYKHIPFLSLITEEALTEENNGDMVGHTGPRVVTYADAMLNMVTK